MLALEWLIKPWASFTSAPANFSNVAQRVGPMLGLKSFGDAAVVIGGVELAARIQKGQLFERLGRRTARMPKIWQAALAA